MKSMKDLMSLFEMDSDKKEDSKECKTCQADPCSCEDELDESLMREYKHYVQEALPNTPQGQQVGAQGTQQSGAQSQNPTQQGTAQAGAQAQAQKPAQPAQGQQPQQPAGNEKPMVPQPKQPVQPGALPDPQEKNPNAPAGQQQPQQSQQPGQPDPTPNPNALKQTTDQLTKILSNPQDPKNGEIRDLLKNAGLMK